jgi:hypothetical protein
MIDANVRKDSVSYYMDEILYLTKIFFKDSIPYNLIRCSDNKEFKSANGQNKFIVFAYGGNLNEISVVVNSSSDHQKIEYTVRDIGDLAPYRDCE